MKRLMPVIIALLLLLPFGGARASGSEHITSFRSVASLSQANVLTVSETIVVDFGDAPHHGIYRNIPIVLHGGGDSYYYTFKLLSISSSTGASTNIASQGTSGDDYQVKIGDAYRSISGTQSYTLDYTLSPVSLQNGNVDRVNLNVTGQGWEYPIDQADIELKLPVAPLATPICYTGPTGATSHDCTVSVSATTVTARTNVGLGADSGMTVDMNLPSGSFRTYLIANQRPPLSPVAILFAAIGGLFGIGSLFVTALYARRAWANRRIRKNQTIVAQYEAPDSLSPGQIGLLLDSKSGMLEFTATIIDLAVRGYMKITRLETKTLGVFTNVDYRFDRLKPGSDLKNFERAAYTMVMPDEVTDDTLPAAQSTTLSQISQSSMASANKAYLQDLNDGLEKSLTTAGYYSPEAKLWVRYMWALALGGGFVAELGGGIGSAVGVGIITGGLTMILISFFTIRYYPSLTPAGAAEWAKIEGFKLYLGVAEKDRLNFTDAPERTPERFNKLLPYAVALGVESKWAKQFEGIDVTPSNGWYGGGDMSGLGTAAFASSFAGSFASSVNSSFAGSSGAGGAGGGGGGGGGGGW